MSLASLSIASTVPLSHCPSSVSLPLLGFGTYLCSREEARSSVLAALRAGYRHVDTAEFYDNHEGIAEAIQESGIAREQIFITDKVSPGGIFGAPERTFEETYGLLDRQLARLQTSYLDLYLLHTAYAKTERLNQYRALLQLQSEGKLRAVGVSNWNVSHLEELQRAGLPLPAVNQIEVHPLCTQAALVAFCQAHGIVVMAYSSLAPLACWRERDGAARAGKTDGDAQPSLLQSIANKHGKSEAQVLLRWALQKGIAVIPKSVNEERIKANADLFDFHIAEEDMRALDALDENKPFAWPSMNPLDCP